MEPSLQFDSGAKTPDYLRVILECVVGSTVHGLSVDDGVEDLDILGIGLESYEQACGLSAPFEQFIYRTAAEREGKHDAKSRAGDVDFTVFSLRKFLRLALKGNPTILVPLFAKPTHALPVGQALQALTPAIISRKAGGAFLGYLTAQKQRLVGERGQKDVKRLELEALYGFDTKYAYHMLRLGFQGMELMDTGKLTLPVPEPTRGLLLRVRTGKVSLNECLTLAGQLEADLKESWETSPLQKEPDIERVNRFMLKSYWEHWNATFGHQQTLETNRRFKVGREFGPLVITGFE